MAARDCSLRWFCQIWVVKQLFKDFIRDVSHFNCILYAWRASCRWLSCSLRSCSLASMVKPITMVSLACILALAYTLGGVGDSWQEHFPATQSARRRNTTVRQTIFFLSVGLHCNYVVWKRALSVARADWMSLPLRCIGNQTYSYNR